MIFFKDGLSTKPLELKNEKKKLLIFFTYDENLFNVNDEKK